MALNFPSAPTVNQTYTAEGRTFVWNGAVWLLRPKALPFATQAEVNAGTSPSLTVSPATTKGKTDQIPRGGVHPFSGTPTNVLASRSSGVRYENQLGRPMLLQAWGVASMTFSVTPYGAAFGGALIEQSRPDSTSNTYLLGLVPSGYSYLLVVNSGHTLSGWTEYR